MVSATATAGPRNSRWLAAAVLGLLSSSYSTLISQLSAERMGRDAAVDWMSVASIPARDWALSSEPSSTAIAIGIAFHQWADFSWALFFFGVLGRWTHEMRPGSLALLAVPWAAATSSLEWFVLVPLLPFWQPIFTLQQPLWIGFLVHLSSALIYPLYPWLHQNGLAVNHRRFVTTWMAALAAILLGLACANVLAHRDLELGWIGKNPAIDQTFIRHMSSHHQQGIALATLAVDRASDAHLRSLAKLMVASQAGEQRILENWWRRWFSMTMEICSSAETAAMPGYLTSQQIDGVRSAQPRDFDAVFIEAMTAHHLGAATMADDELRHGSDPRLRAMAHAIRHAQQGEIALMNKVSGAGAVTMATRNMLEVGPTPVPFSR